jgi:hypothetical protein
MSKIPVCPQKITSSAIAEMIIDAWILEGGLELDDIKTEQPISHELKNFSYTFNSELFSLEVRIYWVSEDNEIRQYIWIECCIGKLNCNSEIAMRSLLETSREIPAPFKLALSDNFIVLVFRGPVEGFNPDFLQDLVEQIIPFASRIYEDLKEKFLILSWRESLQSKRTAH